MSLDRCKDCECVVDTDDEPECYYLNDEVQDFCRCEGCREALTVETV